MLRFAFSFHRATSDRTVTRVILQPLSSRFRSADIWPDAEVSAPSLAGFLFESTSGPRAGYLASEGLIRSRARRAVPGGRLRPAGPPGGVCRYLRVPRPFSGTPTGRGPQGAGSVVVGRYGRRIRPFPAGRSTISGPNLGTGYGDQVGCGPLMRRRPGCRCQNSGSTCPIPPPLNHGGWFAMCRD